MKKRYVLKNKTRFITFIVSILLLSAFIFCVPNVQGYSTQKYETVVISKGDTLWDIALKFSSPGQDVRKLVYDIKKANNMNNSIICEGDIIKVPSVGLQSRN